MTALAWSAVQRWPQVPFRYLFRPLVRPVPDGAEIVTAYTDGMVTLRANRRLTGYHEAADLSNFQGVEPGDFVVHGLDIMRGSVGVSDARGAISSVCTVCQPVGGIDPRYVAYVIRLQAASGYPKALARGVRQGGADFRRWETLAELPIPAPPLEEQRRIADFLDVETERIDRLVAKQTALIETLRERRSAAITDFATRGVLPHELVDSGDPYLGSVPSPWTVTRLRRVMSINGGQVDPREDPWSEMVLLAPNHVESGTGRILGIETAAEQGADSGKYLVESGQIVYSKIRPTLNKVAIAPQDCLCSADMYAMSPGPDVHSRYALYFLLSRPFLRFASATAMRVKMPKVNREELADAPWLLPPVDEQAQIVDRIEAQSAKIDALIEKAERFIELARERRAALITAAVTGQIEVPEVAA